MIQKSFAWTSPALIFMTLTYIKLNDFDYYHGGFPLAVIGTLCDGVKSFPLIFPLKGTVLLQTNLPILEADEKLREMLSVKKLPPDVIVEVEP